MNSMARNIIALFAWQGANYVLPLLTLPYLARVLGPEQFGVLAFSQAVTAYFVLLSDWGFALSAAQAVSRQRLDPQALSRILVDTVWAKCLLALATFLLLLLAIATVPPLRAHALVILCSWLAVPGSVLTLNWFLQGVEKLDRLVAAGLIGKLVTLPLVFLCVKSQGDTWIAALLQSAGGIVAGLVSIHATRRLDMVRWQRPALAGAIMQIRAGAPLFFAAAAVNLYTTTNTVVLGFFASTREVGQFNGADRLRGAAQGLLAPLSQAAFPRVNFLMAHSREEAFRFLRKMLWVQGGIALAISAAMYVLAPLAVHLVLGKGYEASIGLLRWFSLLPFVLALSNVFGIQTMLPLGMNREFSLILMLSGLVNVLMVIPLCMLFGAEGVVASIVIVEIGVTVCMGWLLAARGVHLFRMQ